MFEVIHPNRWFFWAIAIILIAGLLLWWAVEQYSIEQDALVYQSIYTIKSHPTTLDTSNWKTYRNEEYGSFELRIPNNWRVVEDSIVMFFDQKGEFLIGDIAIDSNPEHVTLQNIAKRAGLVIENISVSYMTIGGEKAIRYRTGPDREIAQVIHNNYIYTISDGLLAPEILSTFKFVENIKIPIVDTSSWLEYKNDQYGFKIKYPPNWSWKDLLPNNPQLGTDALIGFAPKSFGGVDFEVLIQVNKRGLDINANEISNQLNENTALVSISNILFKGKSGKKIILQNKTTKSDSTMIVISGPGNLFYIISLPTEDDFRIFSTLDFF